MGLGGIKVTRWDMSHILFCAAKSRRKAVTDEVQLPESCLLAIIHVPRTQALFIVTYWRPLSDETLPTRTSWQTAERQRTEISGIRTPRPRQGGNTTSTRCRWRVNPTNVSGTRQRFLLHSSSSSSLLLLLLLRRRILLWRFESTALTLRRPAAIVFCFYLIYFSLLLHRPITNLTVGHTLHASGSLFEQNQQIVLRTNVTHASQQVNGRTLAFLWAVAGVNQYTGRHVMVVVHHIMVWCQISKYSILGTAGLSCSQRTRFKSFSRVKFAIPV